MPILVTAHQKFIRQTPQKLRLVADMIRKLRPATAMVQLEVSTKKAAGEIAKVVNQAIKNATNNSGLKPETLKFKEIQIMEGPTYKRWNPVSRGRAHKILKRTSHIKVVLEGEKGE